MKIRNLLPTVRSGKEQEIDHLFYSLQREMNRLFDNFFRGFDISSRGFYESDLGGFSPSIDVKENEKEFIIKAEIPGVAKEDIEATVSNDSVTIKGEKKEEKEDKNKNYYYMERSYGSFHRMIPLATEVESSKAEGRFKNGVIDIKLPKSQNAQTKRVKIPIKIG